MSASTRPPMKTKKDVIRAMLENEEAIYLMERGIRIDFKPHFDRICAAMRAADEAGKNSLETFDDITAEIAEDEGVPA